MIPFEAFILFWSGNMHGLMQQQNLLISNLIKFAEKNHGDTEIVSRRVEGDIHVTHWAEVSMRSKQVACALDSMGIPVGSRVATLAWNGYRHLELYFGVSGSERVLHTINPRLLPEQIAWIVNHAEDQVLCFDMTFLPIVQKIQSLCPGVKAWIALADEDKVSAMEGSSQLLSYESWIESQASKASHYEWPVFDENTASSLCYTSGTTGHPKGALYSHRSTLLHCLSLSLPDVFSMSALDTVLPVVPMFHVNAWGMPYSAAMVGARLVFPGPALDGKSVYELIESQKVTFAAGVPTVWLMLLGHMKPNQLHFSSLKRTVIGGAACPESMIKAFQDDYGVQVLHAWGMTEMSPLGTVGNLKIKHLNLSKEDQLKLRAKQGRVIYGVDMKIVGDNGTPQPHDGKAFGDLHVRGPWVIDKYFKEDHSALIDGWFPTGDVATIDEDGFMQITDRSKDVIKSGGEWISSIDIENIAVSHPSVAMAACVGMPHPKWDERPLLVVVLKAEQAASKDDILKIYEGRAAKWQIPDDVVFLDSIPLGATGKMLKTRLREILSDYKWPN
jgi:fatty-acyl-CoA synthase